MKARKSIIALVLALCMVLGCVGTVFAKAGETNLVMVLDKTSVDVGSVVTVTIKLKEAMTDVSWLVGGINFDKTAFQCTSIKSVSGTESALDVKLHVDHKFDYTNDQQTKYYKDVDITPTALATTATAAETGAVGFAFEVSADSGATVSMPGEYIIQATFKALKVPDGGTAEFSLYEQTTTIPANGTYAYYQGEAVPGSAVNVTITQPAYKVGDVNNDGKINKLDQAIIQRYLAGWEGYEAQIVVMDAADINKDGKVNKLDQAIIQRYLAGWGGDYDAYFPQ